MTSKESQGADTRQDTLGPRRILIVVPPFTGHINPTVALGRALTERGHTVAWVGHPSRVRSHLPEGATLIALDDAVPIALAEAVTERAMNVRGLTALKFLWDDVLLPLARAMTDGVEAAIAGFKPDIMVVDQQAFAGALMARRHGIPWVTSASTSVDLMANLGGLPKVQEWMLGRLAELQEEAGLAPVPRPDCADTVLIWSTEALAGPITRFPAGSIFVGPAIAGRPDADLPPEYLADPKGRPRVLVSLGSLNAERGARFFRAAIEALDAAGAFGILAMRPNLLPEYDQALGNAPPEHILMRAWVPQLALLPHLDAVVCHAGHNTTCEALSHGLPLVVAPIKDDQPAVAEQVTEAGAGVRVRFGRIRPKALADAISAVLTDAKYRNAAAAIQESFAKAGGPELAAIKVEEALQ